MRLSAADFAGLWSLSRRIEDRRAGQAGGFSGTANFSVSGPNRLRYEETGRLTLSAGPAFEARRAYLWTFASGRVEVAFDDGRAFHSFRPQGQGAGTDHPCGADAYRVVYDFRDWPRWSSVWEVTGPRKDYTMRSDYAPPG